MGTFLEALKPREIVPFDIWAERYYSLPRGNRFEGLYQIARTPYVREILQAMTPGNGINKVVIKKGTQTGATTLLHICIAAIVDQNPGHIMLVLPTEALARIHSVKKLTPELEGNQRLRGKFPKRKSREVGNTILLKMFPGGSLTLGGANQVGMIRSNTIQYLFMSDVDGFEMDSGEGHVLSVFEKRTDFWTGNRKIVIESTPSWENLSLIEDEYDRSSMGKFMSPCPNCKKAMFFDIYEGQEYGFKYTHKDGNVKEAYYICHYCGYRIEEKDKSSIANNSFYKHKYSAKIHNSCGFFFTSFVSSVLPWLNIATEHLESRGDFKKEQVFDNTRRGKAYRMPGTQIHQYEKLKQFALSYQPFEIPTPLRSGEFILGAGVDTQDDRLYYIVRAYTKTKSWLVANGEFVGDPMYADVWEQLHGLLTREFKINSGGSARIQSCAIDSQGHRTQYVKNFCRGRDPIVIPIKGASARNYQLLSPPRNEDVNYKGKKPKYGLGVYMVGGFQARLHFFSSLNTVFEPDEKRKNFFYLASDDYFRQITSASLTKKIVKGIQVPDFVIRGADHYLDCEAYSYAGVSRFLNHPALKD